MQLVRIVHLSLFHTLSCALYLGNLVKCRKCVHAPVIEHAWSKFQSGPCIQLNFQGV